MPEQYRAMVLLAAWCALRFGELTELRRKDIIIVEPTEEQLANALANSEKPPESYGIVRVERAVVRTEDGFKATTPKSDAGIRDVEIPPHLLPVIKDHLARSRRPKARRPAVPGAARRPPGPRDAVPAFLHGPRYGQARRPALA